MHLATTIPPRTSYVTQYRYILAPYKGPATRHTCPGCQKPRQFTRYIDTHTAEALEAYVGRCNRAIKCGYHYTPKQYFALHGAAAQGKARSCIAPPPPRPQAKADFIDFALFQQSLKNYAHNHFVYFLQRLFGPERAQALIARYYIGTAKHWPGATLFWQIDLQGRVRSGKIMLYDPGDGKRVKQPFSHIYWAHKKLSAPRFHLEQCLFGLHQLRTAPAHQPVALVESEKTAIIASGYFPQWIWLAVGSQQLLQAAHCQGLEGRNILLFPDQGALAAWQERAPRLAQALGAQVRVSWWIEESSENCAGEQGGDLADFLTSKAWLAAPGASQEAC